MVSSKHPGIPPPQQFLCPLQKINSCFGTSGMAPGLWVCVQGSDPSQYEMIQKMQMLQKRLITKTEEVVEKELLIQEKEKLYMELKHILARQPGPEVAEQLHTYQATLKDKTRQMKVDSVQLE